MVNTFGGPPATPRSVRAAVAGHGAPCSAWPKGLTSVRPGSRRGLWRPQPRSGAARERRVDLRELGDPDATCTSRATWSSSRRPTAMGRHAGVVREVGEGWVTFDFNHPLAGQAVSFEVHLRASSGCVMDGGRRRSGAAGRARGFCAGVDRAIEIVERALEKFGAPIYVRHEIVHNHLRGQRPEGQGARSSSRTWPRCRGGHAGVQRPWRAAVVG